MKIFYYVAQSTIFNGFAQHARLHQAPFFDWKVIKKGLIADGIKDPICIFFKEINEEEFNSFVSSIEE
jgi:hypothetical protein